MDLCISGRRALVTASSSGIGKCCAAILVAEGARVFICARNQKALAAAASEIGAAGHAIVDLYLTADVRRLVATAARDLGGLDILVTNTPNPSAGLFAEQSDSDWERNHEGVLMSVVRLIREARPWLVRSGNGRIVNITSTAATEAIPGRLLSSTYRSAIHAMAKHLAFEMGQDGITVNNIAPGYIKTPSWDEASATEVAAGVPLGRLGLSDEVGALCAYLCSEQASYITGQTIAIAGGLGSAIR